MKTLDQYEQRRLTLPECELLIMVTVIEARGEAEKFGDTLADCDVFQILSSRTLIPTMATVRAFAATLCETPGQAVLWAHTITVLGLDNLEKFCAQFATGIPTDAAYAQAWADQKSLGGNMLDTEKWI